MTTGVMCLNTLFLIAALFFTFAWAMKVVVTHANIGKGLNSRFDLAQSFIPAVLWGILWALMQ